MINVDSLIFQEIIYVLKLIVFTTSQPKENHFDLNRDYFSFKEGFFTKHITNEAIDTHLEEIADAIAHVAHNAPNKIGKNLKS